MTSIHTAALEAAHGEAATLEGVEIHAGIDDLMTVVNVRQCYRNRGRKHIEAVYSFPLPLEGVLLDFQVELGDRRLSGTVVERSDAARRYEDAVTDGDAAVLLEQPQPGLYTASVGNLAPGETATVRFRYGLLLRWNADRVGLVIPTTIAPRYGDPASGGLAPHQEPVYGVGAEPSFKVKVAVRGVLRQASWTSPSHDVTVTPEGGQTTIALARPAAMDRDLVLEARSTAASASQALVARDDEGWVALASFRPEMPDMASEPGRRNVKIVVDCSGSMAGDSIAQVRIAGERILDSLGPGDRFDIVAFGSGQRVLFGRETPATAANVARARRFVRGLDADMGGTEIGAALEVAYGIGGEGGMRRDLLLITDGEVWDAAPAVERARGSDHRIFTVGVGSAVAEPFVRALAEATGGACELVAPRADMGERIHRHFQRIGATPVRAARLHWPAPVRHVVPDPLPPPFPGDTMHLFGSFTERPRGAVVLEMELADGRTVSQRMEIDADPAETAATQSDHVPPRAGARLADDPTEAETAAAQSDLARLGAARRLATLDDRAQATALAVRYQLMSEWTNYLVVHVREAADKADGLPDLVKVPQVLAAGWHGAGTVHEPAAPGRPGRRPVALMRLESPAPTDEAYSFHRSRNADFLYDGPPAPASEAPAGIEEMEGLPASPEGGDRQAATPADLVAKLNEWPMPPMPAFDDLAAWLPDEVREGLAALVDGGGDAESVVIVFLHLLSESEAGHALDRQRRRRILAARKKLSVDEGTVAAVRRVLRESWAASGA